jgi:hypothetical protein
MQGGSLHCWQTRGIICRVAAGNLPVSEVRHQAQSIPWGVWFVALHVT